ncbi:MAG: HD-GYP domain-containing protein [Nitrospirota bacterium]
MASKEDREIHKSARDIISQLSIVLRTANIHDLGNIAVKTAIDKFLSLINPLIESERSILLELIGEFFYMNGTRVRYSLEYLLNFGFLVWEFKKREIGSVIFKSIVSPADIDLFLKAFIVSGSSKDPYETMFEEMAESKSIGIDKLKKIKEEEQVDTRDMIKKTYFNAVSYIRELTNKIKLGEKVNIKKAKRIVETIVEQLLEGEQFLLAMTAIKDYDEYTYHHSVNVSILSIALGQRLGLSRKMLTEIGLAALFHDIGKIEIPNEVLNKPTNFNDDEWKIIRRHPVWGLRAILRLRGFDSTAIRAAIVAFEHHIYCDHSGYPKTKKYLDIDLYSRIVTIADQYDAMTSSRVYSRIPIAPDKALSIMMERTGTQLDPLFFKFFINLVGIYPVGTLVMLDTKEFGLVYECNIVFSERPKVLIIVDKDGKKVQGPIVNLAEKDGNDRYLRSIVKTLDLNKYKINLAEYLL